jgi:hypothetical protein
MDVMSLNDSVFECPYNCGFKSTQQTALLTHISGHTPDSRDGWKVL